MISSRSSSSSLCCALLPPLPRLAPPPPRAPRPPLAPPRDFAGFASMASPPNLPAPPATHGVQHPTHSLGAWCIAPGCKNEESTGACGTKAGRRTVRPRSSPPPAAQPRLAARTSPWRAMQCEVPAFLRPYSRLMVKNFEKRTVCRGGIPQVLERCWEG